MLQMKFWFSKCDICGAIFGNKVNDTMTKLCSIDIIMGEVDRWYDNWYKGSSRYISILLVYICVIGKEE